MKRQANSQQIKSLFNKLVREGKTAAAMIKELQRLGIAHNIKGDLAGRLDIIVILSQKKTARIVCNKGRPVSADI